MTINESWSSAEQGKRKKRIKAKGKEKE